MKNRTRVVKIVFTLVGVILVGSVFIERTTLPQTSETMYRQSMVYGTAYGKETPPRPFVYDGCTFFLDSLFTSDFTEACSVHDMAYWYGGTGEERKNADKKLREDLKKTGTFGYIVSYPAYIAVRLFGDSLLTKSVHAHWGFGWE